MTLTIPLEPPDVWTSHPSTDTSLTANLICRVPLALLGTLLCWVPFRLLCRHGEFAAVVLIVDVAILNLFTILNSLLWHTNDYTTWWDGTGLCDVQVWLWYPLNTAYSACIFAIMRHMAGQVRLMRASALTGAEWRRRCLVEALTIFPVPTVQLAFTWFDLSRRYVIGTLVGCQASYDSSWPRVLVYNIPPNIFAIGTIPYACECRLGLPFSNFDGSNMGANPEMLNLRPHLEAFPSHLEYHPRHTLRE
jgi:pheromone a factor receptor